MDSRSNLCSKSYKWSGDDFVHGRLQAFAIDDPLHIDITSLSHDARDYLQDNDSKLVSVVTMGDGACGVHAVFGEPSVNGVLYKEAARRLAENLLGPNPQALRQAGVEERYISAIGQSFWNEFAKPELDEKSEAQGAERLLFWNALQNQRPDLVHECRTCHSEYARVTQEHVHARRVFISASQSFFTFEMEWCFVRPLAIGRGFLPQGIQIPVIPDLLNIVQLQQHYPMFTDWLGSAADETGYIKASQPRVLFPAGGPSCKYMALFEASSAYDGLRQAFIEGTHASCHESKEVLGSIIQQVIQESSSPGNCVSRALQFIDEMNTYENAYQRLQNVNAAPIDFVSQAWQVYLSCIQNTGYFFQ